MSVGQVISDTFGMVKGRFGSLLGLWAVYFGITMVLSVVFVIGIGAAGLAGVASIGESDALAGSNALAVGTGMVVLFVVFYVVYILVAMAQYASMIIMASPLRQTTFGDALGAGWRAAPTLLLLMVVLILGYLAVAIVLSLAGAAASAIGNAGSAVLVLVLLPVLVWLGCRLAPLLAVVAVDGVRNPFTAIARSWRLTRGYALTIFLASLAFMVILLLVCGVALLPSIGLLRSMADPAGFSSVEAAAQPALGAMLLFFLGILVVSVLFNLCYCAFMAVIHGTLAGAAGEETAEAFA
jgi:hypothetical protein